MEVSGTADTLREQHFQLLREFRLLHLLYHRNKNQHRVARWWRYLNMLKRNCGQVLEMLQKSISTKHQAFKLYRLLTKFTNTLSKELYYAFNGIIALGQFVTLGVILLGMLGRIYSLYKHISDIYAAQFDRFGCGETIVSPELKEKLHDQEVALLEKMAEEELGEEILNSTGVSGTEAAPKGVPNVTSDTSSLLSKNKKKNGKKKKKKSKSVIDGIFD